MLEALPKSIKTKHILKHYWIEDVITNYETDTPLVSVAGFNPSLYEVDPQRDEILLRLNHENYCQPLPCL
jgi:hypothetical protein